MFGKRLATVASVVLLCGACQMENLGARGKFEERIEKSFAMRPGGTLSVSNFNGAVEILGWEKDRVQVVAIKYASTQEDLRAIQVEMELSGDVLRIRTVRPGGRWGNMGARYVIRAPFQTRLDEIETSNGSLKVEDMDGYQRLRTSNGAVRLARVSGEGDVRTSNGGVEAYEAEGEWRVKTTNGSVTVEQFSGALEVETSNGAVKVEAGELRERQAVKMLTSNGSIEFAARALKGNDITATTSNGAITLRLPEQLDARIVARAGSGKVSCEFPLEGAQVKGNEIEGVAGKGTSTIRARTTNATIQIVKGRAGA